MANLLYRVSTTPTVPGSTSAKGTPLTNLEVDGNFKSIADDLALKATISSPTFTGIPAAPTAAAGTNTTQLATTAFVTAGLNLKANIDSPTFTGTPAAPTAVAGTNTTQLATTAFVQSAVSAVSSSTYSFETNTANIKVNGTVSVGVLGTVARADHIHPTDTSRAPLASPTFTGVPAAPTAVAGTNTTQLATTAFVQTGLSGYVPTTDVSTSGGANKISKASATGLITSSYGFSSTNGAIWTSQTWIKSFINVLGSVVWWPKGTTTYAKGIGATNDDFIYFTRSTAEDISAVAFQPFLFNMATGDFTATGNVTAYSDIRLKTEIEPIQDALSKIKALVGITYKPQDSDKRNTGLIAQDVQKVLPEAVLEDKEGMLSIAYGNLAGLFVQAINELDQRLSAIEAKME